MTDLDFSGQVPWIVAGTLVGIVSFVPLVLVLIPALRRSGNVSMVKGMLGIITSFGLLVMGVMVTWLLSRPSLVAFAIGEIVGFFVCWTLVAVVFIVRRD